MQPSGSFYLFTLPTYKTEASVFEEFLARLVLQRDYNHWVKEHKDYKELTEWLSTRIKLNPFFCLCVHWQHKLWCQEQGTIPGAVSLLTYMKAPWLSGKCDLTGHHIHMPPNHLKLSSVFNESLVCKDNSYSIGSLLKTPSLFVIGDTILMEYNCI